MRPTALKTGVLVLALAVLLSQAACGGRGARPQTLSEQERQQLGVVGVVGVNYSAGCEFVRPPAGVFEGLWRGMTKGALVGTLTVLSGGNVACLVAAPAGGVVGGLIGAVVGGVKAPDRKRVLEAEETLRKCLSDMSLAGTFRETLLSEAGNWTSLVAVSPAFSGPSTPDERVDYRPLAKKGFDTVLEAGVLDCGLSGESLEIDPPLALTVSARVRVVRVQDNSLIYDEVFRTAGQKRLFLEWAEDDGSAFRAEVTYLYRMLAVTMVERVFLVRVPEMAVSREMMAPSPLKFVEPALGTYVSPITLDSLRPTLQWESFPRPEDLKLDREGLLTDAQEIVYELKIWSFGRSGTTGLREVTGLVYHRDGLAATEHAVEEALEPSAEYLVSVRAWYRAQGQLWATPDGAVFFKTPD